MRLPALLAAIVTATLAGAATLTGATAAASPFSASGTDLHYARIVPACTQAAPGSSACMALRRVPVAAGTKGAISYRADTAAAGGPASGYTPGQLATAYGVNPRAATSQTVAVVDAYHDPYARAELNTFDHHYGLPAETRRSLRIVNQRGSSSSHPRTDTGWASEIALDLQAVRGMCNRCKLLLVEADSATNNALAIAVNTAVRRGARIVTNSYGGPEAYSTPRVRAAYNHPGVVITASTGDDGWYGWDYANDPYGTAGTSANMPDTPAAYPSVVAVGGTSLALASNGVRRSETVWNSDGVDDAAGARYGEAAGASGGGCSLRYAVRQPQAGVRGFNGLGCKGKRMVGDVAAVADPATGYDIVSHYDRGWVTYGGTSLSSPIIAALYALAGGPRGVRNPAETLYDNFRFRPRAVHDVTRGGNSFCGGDDKTHCASAVSRLTVGSTRNPNGLTNGNTARRGGWTGLLDCGFGYGGGTARLSADKQCNARAGFDGPSGVGTPAAIDLFRPIRPMVSFTLPQALKLRTSATFVGHVRQMQSAITVNRYVWHWGDGTVTSGRAAASAKHTFRRPGSYRVTLGVTDSLGQWVPATRTVTVGKPLRLKIAGARSVRTGRAAKWSDWGSSDPNTTGRFVRVTWWWGDRAPARSGRHAWHTYRHAGRHNITMRVADSTGVVTVAKQTIIVTR